MGVPVERASPALRFGRSLTKDWVLTVCCFILIGLVLVALVGPLLTPFDASKPELVQVTKAPGFHSPDGRVHLLGTDQMGRDLLSRIIAGARISLGISVTAALLSAAIGITLGVLAGWKGGWIGEAILRLTDIQLAFPYILLILVLSALLRPSWFNVVFVLAISKWPTYTRILSGEVSLIREHEYVEAAIALGAPSFRILLRHVLPNCVGPILTLLTFDVAQNISSEAVISFLGAGVPPTSPTWGRILAESRNYLVTSWWLALFPGLAITLSMLSMNVFGDWVRDRLDPRLRGLD